MCNQNILLMRIKHIFLFCLAAIMMVASGLMAQVDTIPPPTDFDLVDFLDALKGVKSYQDLLLLFDPILGLVVLIGGYLSAYIPGLNKITSGTYRVLAFGILAIAIFAVFGFAPAWQGVITFMFTTGLYKYLFKIILPSPKPAEVAK